MVWWFTHGMKIKKIFHVKKCYIHTTINAKWIQTVLMFTLSKLTLLLYYILCATSFLVNIHLRHGGVILNSVLKYRCFWLSWSRGKLIFIFQYDISGNTYIYWAQELTLAPTYPKARKPKHSPSLSCHYLQYTPLLTTILLMNYYFVHTLNKKLLQSCID